MEVDVYEFLGKWGDTVRAMQATVPDDEEEYAVLRTCDPHQLQTPRRGNRR